jgi:hypothetical protein
LNISEPSHESEWVEECKCVMISECISNENDASIDIRIITVGTIGTSVLHIIIYHSNIFY